MSARLNAHGRTDNSTAHVYFEYAQSQADLGTPNAQRSSILQIPANVPGPGKGDIPFYADVSGLSPGTTYYFQVCGGDGQVNPDACGGVRSFITQRGVPGVSVSVGYADDETGPNPFPADWGTSTSSVSFIGGPGPPSAAGGRWDSGGLRFDNSTSLPVKLDDVKVNIGAYHFNANDDLWTPAQLTVPPHGALILASKAGGNYFDTSDFHCQGTPAPIPQIVVTQAGVQTAYYDNTGILTYDCSKPETHPWQRVDVTQ